ncbi:MAG: hypothetical protein NW207_05795 [Cytophagales bacterium]|nr:hypothetical protein [Cytophagales bacterium]
MTTEEVKNIVLANIDNEKYFLTDFNIVRVKNTPHIKLSIDTDLGITIDECAHISRILNNIFAKNDIYPDGYELHVTSPGIGEPLKMERQYHKNVGRNIRLITMDNVVIDGKLEAVTADQGINILVTKTKKGKIIEQKNTYIPFNNIKKTEVLISFN